MQRHTQTSPVSDMAATRASAAKHELVQRSRAMRTVADHATDVQDCQDLLVMLGLDAEPNATGPQHLGQIP